MQYLIIKHEQISDYKAKQKIYLLRIKALDTTNQIQPGEFIMLRITNQIDPLLARPFSIYSAKNDELSILYQITGKGTYILSKKQKGEILNLRGPLGKKFNFKTQKPILIAGGIGIAPIHYIASNLIKKNKNIIPLLWGLKYSNSYTKLIIKLKKNIKNTNINLLIISEDGIVSPRGTIINLFYENLKYGDSVLACGPIPMLKTIAYICINYNIPCYVSLETPMACGIGVCQGCTIPTINGKYLLLCQNGPILDATIIDWRQLN